MELLRSGQGSITLDLRKVNIRALDIEHIQAAVQLAHQTQPDLARYLDRITLLPTRPLSRSSSLGMTEDERWMLEFINVSGRYIHHYGPPSPGRIVVQYIPFVDFISGTVLHELAHVIIRARDPDRVNRVRREGKRNDTHSIDWSRVACGLYHTFGCEQAALVTDGMAYKSLRKRHGLLLPEHYHWANKVWGRFDTRTYGSLRQEFTELFS